MSRPRIVIVGAGVSGLCCALRLAERSIDAAIVEAGPQVGGRVVTERREDCLVDRGFQILLTAYPEPRRWLDLARHRLKAFPPGALVWDGTRFRRVPHPLRHPLQAIAAFFSGTVGLRDGFALLPRLWGSLFRRPEAPTVVGKSVADTVGRQVRPFFREAFLRSFFGGVFLDRSLGTDLGQLDFCFSMFASGDAAVPTGGMAEIPRQLAARIDPGSIRFNARVVAVRPGEVEVADGSRERGDAVVVATDHTVAKELLGDLAGEDRPWQATVMAAFETAAEDARDGMLHLDGTGEGPVNHACFISAVASNYAPPQRGLLYANVVDPRWIAEGDEALETAIRGQLGRWFGHERVAAWRLRAMVRIPRALPRQHPADLASPRPLRLAPGLFRCGDAVGAGSLNGAMRSGRLAADAVAAWLATRRPA